MTAAQPFLQKLTMKLIIRTCNRSELEVFTVKFDEACKQSMQTNWIKGKVNLSSHHQFHHLAWAVLQPVELTSQKPKDKSHEFNYTIVIEFDHILSLRILDALVQLI